MRFNSAFKTLIHN